MPEKEIFCSFIDAVISKSLSPFGINSLPFPLSLMHLIHRWNRNGAQHILKLQEECEEWVADQSYSLVMLSDATHESMIVHRKSGLGSVFQADE